MRDETPHESRERIQKDIAAGRRCETCFLLLPCWSEHAGAVEHAGGKRGEGNYDMQSIGWRSL